MLPLYLGRSGSEPDELLLILHAYIFYQELGRPAAAAAALGRLSQRDVLRPLVSMVMLTQARYGHVDSAATAEALARLGSPAAVARDSASRKEQDRGICAMERWRLGRGSTRTARASIARLAGGRAWNCAVVLEAQLAAVEHRSDAEAAFGRLDSLLLAGGGRPEWAMELARWHEARGDAPAALRAARRCFAYGVFAVNLSYCLREQGRLAVLVGDRAGAIRAYRHYLALRYSPEASMKPEVDRVRGELALLEGESK
jgi:hypothetical protein